MDIDSCAPQVSKRKSHDCEDALSDTPKKKKPEATLTEDITSHPEFNPALFIRISDLCDDTISSMPKNSIAQLLTMKVLSSNKLKHFKYLLSLSESQVKEKAKSVRDSIVQKKKNTPSSLAATTSYANMDREELCKAYANMVDKSKSKRKFKVADHLTDNELRETLIKQTSSHKRSSSKSRSRKSKSPPPETSIKKETMTVPHTDPVSSTCNSNPTSTPNTPQPPVSSQSISTSTNTYSSGATASTSTSCANGENAPASASRPKLKQMLLKPSNVTELVHDCTNTTKIGIDTKVVDLNTIAIRPRFFIKKFDLPYPALARLVFNKILEWDNTAVLLPFDGSAQDTINSDTHIPDDVDQAKTWIANMRIEKNNYRTFAMLIRIPKSVGYMKGKIYRWMGDIGCFSKVDEISSDKVSCLGLFDKLHPDFHNRDRLATHIHAHLTEAIGRKIYVSVYSRPVFAGKGYDKVSTSAVVVDVAHEEAAEISEHLFSLPLDMYSDVMFVPFMKIDDAYRKTLQKVITSNDEFSNSVEELNLPMLKFFNYDVKYTTTCRCMRDILFQYNTPE